GTDGDGLSEASGDGEYAAGPQAWHDGCQERGVGWISWIDGGQDACDLRDAELAGGGVGALCAEKSGDGDLEEAAGDGINARRGRAGVDLGWKRLPAHNNHSC